MKLAPLPSPTLAARPLPTIVLPTGTRLVRIHWPGNALFFGPVPRTPPRNRFDSPTGAFGTCYMAMHTAGAFAETFLRGGLVPLVTETELRARAWSQLEVIAPLMVVPCHGRALARLGTTSAISSGAYSRSRMWFAALHNHPEAPDGLRYRSRHNDDQLCVALFDRASAKVRVSDTLPLLHPSTGVYEAIERHGVAVR